MEELFRFSVIRPASRFNTTTVSLERPTAPPPPISAVAPPAPPPAIDRGITRMILPRPLPAVLATRAPLAAAATPTHPPKSFQDQIRDAVQKAAAAERPVAAEEVWRNDLTSIALAFVLNQAHAILNNPLWAALQTLLSAIQQALLDRSTASTGAVKLLRGFASDQRERTPGYQLDLGDLFLALLIIRCGGPVDIDWLVRKNRLWDWVELLSNNPTLQEIADAIRLLDLLNAGPDALAPPATATTPAAIQAAIQAAFQAAMSKTLLFPPALFSPLQKPIHGVGFREFHVVKQHIRRYELAEIGRIENILRGESRDHTQKHTLSNERDTFLQTETTSETDKELTSTDHVDIKNETQNQVKEDTKVDAGVHAQYDGGSFKLQADLTVAYDKSTDDTKKFSSDVAKDVTQKAVSKVTQTVTQSQTTKIIETFEDTEAQTFDNKTGSGHVSGIYQWVEKVYLAQVFNLGRHMLLDLMIPEPGASLLQAATTAPPDVKPPVAPYPLGTIKMANGVPVLDRDGNRQLDVPLNPLDLSDEPADPNFYGLWVARYNATSVDPPPSDLTIGKALVFPYKDDDDKQASDSIRIDDGYSAVAANISIDAMRNDNPGGAVYVDVTIGAQTKRFPWPGGRAGSDPPRAWQSTEGALLGGETGSIPFTVYGRDINQLNVNMELTCRPSPTLVAKWKLQTYEKLATAWQKLQSDYDTAMKGLAFQKASIGALGAADPEANRLTERIELKRACIAIMDYANETVRGVAPQIAVQNSPQPNLPAPPPNTPDPAYQPVLPEPILAIAQRLGNNVRWFEQAFEWENIAYVSYPYFWGRRSTWLTRLNLKNDDPLFLQFLQAGYARVVVPVRLGFEWAVHFYLHTGRPWLGGRLPAVGDKTQNPLYLDVAEELKALTGGGEPGETETPIGDPWEYTIPTTLIKLRKDDALPEWHRAGEDGKEDEKNYPSDQPGGTWLWRDGAPKP